MRLTVLPPVQNLRPARRALGCALAVIALLAGCASGPPIDTRHRARAQDSRVQHIVLHYTVGDFDSALKTLTQGPVSSHYLVAQQPPTVYRLVDEDRRAFHAGLSSWGGQTGLNGSSIGIEIVNTGPLQPWARERAEPVDWAPFPPAQMAVVIALVRDLAQRHGVRPHRIVGHSDIAPSRKTDPGPLFPWPQLHAAGLVPWPDRSQVDALMARWATAAPAAVATPAGTPTIAPAGSLAATPATATATAAADEPAHPPTDAAWFQQRLARLGYATPAHGQWDSATRDVLIAFQLRYRPRLFNGRPDAETAALLAVASRPGGLLMVQPDGRSTPYTP